MHMCMHIFVYMYTYMYVHIYLFLWLLIIESSKSSHIIICNYRGITLKSKYSLFFYPFTNKIKKKKKNSLPQG